jgi:hypothetical protein
MGSGVPFPCALSLHFEIHVPIPELSCYNALGA